MVSDKLLITDCKMNVSRNGNFQQLPWYNCQSLVTKDIESPIHYQYPKRYNMRIDTDRYWVYNSSVNLIKVNKLVYVASRAYQFGQQYAIILVWKAWSDALNQLNVLKY